MNITGNSSEAGGPGTPSVQSPASADSIKKKQRVRIVIGAVVVVLMIFGGVYFTSGKKKAVEAGKEKSVSRKSVLLRDGVDKEVWMTEAGGKIKAMENENRELKKSIAKMEESFKKLTVAVEDKKKTDRRGVFPPVPLEKIVNENADEGEAQSNNKRAGVSNKVEKRGGVKKDANGDVILPPGSTVVRPASSFPYAKQNDESNTQQPTGVPPGQGFIEDSATIKVFKPEKSSLSNPFESKKDSTWLPSGSFVKAVILSGLDAPTNSGSNSNPYPVLMKLQDTTVLPNKFRMDMRECFVVGEAYGDLSSERAYVRTTSLSCVKKDGSTIDMVFKGFVSGEDGKIGMRGRLVSKEGTMIARALMAGFVSGISSAFKPTPNVNISTTGQPYSFPDVGQVGTAAAMGGVSKSAEILAQHYVDLAKNIYPVIEIDAGRTIDIVSTQGMELEVKEKK